MRRCNSHPILQDLIGPGGGMVYTQHLKCCERNLMRVRLPPWALALVVKLADTQGLGPCAERRRGSNPLEGIGKHRLYHI